MSSKDETTTSKADYEAKLSTHMHQAADQIAELEKQVAETTTETDAWMKTKLDDLKAEHAAAEAEWRRFRAASGESWQDLSKGMSEAYSRLQEAISTAQTRFRDQPARTSDDDAA